MVRIAPVRLHDRHDGARRDEAREVVDVTVRVVALDAVAEPDDLGHAERVAQHALDVRAAQRRVAVRVQQALLGREQRALRR